MSASAPCLTHARASVELPSVEPSTEPLASSAPRAPARSATIHGTIALLAVTHPRSGSAALHAALAATIHPARHGPIPPVAALMMAPPASPPARPQTAASVATKSRLAARLGCLTSYSLVETVFCGAGSATYARVSGAGADVPVGMACYPADSPA
ncbi:MAG: hypothetical protein ACLS3M_09980 [Collinsella sp.]